jgi:hypothetical protein
MKQEEGVGKKKRTDDRSRRELNPVLRVLRSDKFVPRTHRIVQTGDVCVRHVTKGASVVVVPSHCTQVSGGVVLEWRVRGTIEDPGFTCGVGGDWDRGEEVVRVWVEIAEDGGDVEAVDEEGGSTCAAGVLEKVENLHAAGIGLCGHTPVRRERE